MDAIAQIENNAKLCNSPDKWNELWSDEGEDSWRPQAMKDVYSRIVDILSSGNNPQSVIDIGGGRGFLLDCVRSRLPETITTVVDHSDIALRAALAKGHNVYKRDLEAYQGCFACDTFLCTEVLEHLSCSAGNELLREMEHWGSSAIISVPNDRLGPDEEPQHTMKFTAMSFKSLLFKYWSDVRVEVHGAYLLGVCGKYAEKKYRLSVCLPARDEAHDLEKTLASFRGVADEIVVGIDPRSKDESYEVAYKYADKVFFLSSPQGIVGTKGYMGEDGVNFAHVRNQVSAQCTGDWIFMTEGHERLGQGMDTLLALPDIVPSQARVAFVFRNGSGQRWMFPWLYRNSPDMVWRRPVHNALEFPEGTFAVQLPQVHTIHERHVSRSEARSVQRKHQNRRQLMDDWQTDHNVNSLFYLGQEWRDIDPRRAVENLDKFIAISNNGVQKYQARLIMAKETMKNSGRRASDTRKQARDRARDYLMGCAADDWSRTEHWIWLGDLAFEEREFEKAYAFYMYASTTIGNPPMTMWWIDLSHYSYVPAQRLATITAEMGRVEESLAWATKVRELLPQDAPQAVIDEADSNIKILIEALRQSDES